MNETDGISKQEQGDARWAKWDADWRATADELQRLANLAISEGNLAAAAYFSFSAMEAGSNIGRMRKIELLGREFFGGKK